MKFFLVAFCLTAVLFKEISGGVIDTVEGSLSGLRYEIETDLEELVKPINEGVKTLESRLAEYELRKAEIEAFSFSNINFTACTSLGVTIEDSVKLGYNISMTVREMIQNVTNSYNALTQNCSKSWNPVTDVKCFIDNIDVIRHEVESVKALIKTYEKAIMDVVAEVEDEFLTCVGDKVPPTAAPTQKPTAAPTQKPTAAPTQKPTEQPTQKPTEQPTQKPTEQPTQKTAAPTQKPDNGVTTPKPTKKPWWHFW